MKIGDSLTILLVGRIVVLDCKVTYPAAASHVWGASQLVRFTAAKAQPIKLRAFKLFVDGMGHDSLLLGSESFGSRVKR